MWVLLCVATDSRSLSVWTVWTSTFDWPKQKRALLVYTNSTYTKNTTITEKKHPKKYTAQCVSQQPLSHIHIGYELYSDTVMYGWLYTVVYGTQIHLNAQQSNGKSKMRKRWRRKLRRKYWNAFTCLSMKPANATYSQSSFPFI